MVSGASSLAGAGAASRWNFNFSSENGPGKRAACIRRNRIDINRRMNDAAGHDAKATAAGRANSR